MGDSLSCKALTKRFGSRLVVDGVSLKVASGEVVGLLGPNGAGKTSSFYIMVGLHRPDSGEVLLNGKPITHLPMHRRARLGVGYLPQEASIFRGLNVRDNVLAVLETRQKLSSRQRQRRADELLDEFSIAHLANQPSVSLSGGERRRLEIARALAVEPRFMLLDEPFAGVDPIAVNDIRSLVDGLTQRNIGVLITDHSVRETLGSCGRAYIMNNGQVISHGSPDEIASNPLVKEVYLGHDFSL